MYLTTDTYCTTLAEYKKEVLEEALALEVCVNTLKSIVKPTRRMWVGYSSWSKHVYATIDKAYSEDIYPPDELAETIVGLTASFGDGKKTLENAQLVYNFTKKVGLYTVEVTLNTGDAPPNCHIVEEQVWVAPAEGHYRKVKKVICEETGNTV